MPQINPEILIWARTTAGLSIDQAVAKLGIGDARGIAATDRLIAYEAGEVIPSRPLLKKMSKQYHRPLLTFYLSQPPTKGDRGEDFRTLPEGQDAGTEALIDTLIRDIKVRQSMLKAALEDEDEAIALNFVESMSQAAGVEQVTQSMRDLLDFNHEDFWRHSTVEAAFKTLREQAERIGVFVLLKSNLGSHHTNIGVEGFRGFALADKIAPFIVINDQDAKAAWSFTLLHELAHILLGKTGLSGSNADAALEKFCNDVAAEFLLPTPEVQALQFDTASLAEDLSEYASARNLSRSMVAYSLFKNGKITKGMWQQLSGTFRAQWLQMRTEQREKNKGSGSGPNYYIVRQHRLGSALTTIVGRMHEGGTLTTSKAAKVLDIKPKNLHNLLDTGNGGGFSRAS